MNTKCLVLLLLLAVGNRHADATVIALHENAQDPEAEGWTKRELGNGISTFPVIDDMGLGVDAWAINDVASDDEGGYEVPLTAQDISNATTLGWKLSARLRVVEVADPSDYTSVHVVLDFGESIFAMGFNHEDDGSPLINVGGEDTPIVVDLDDLDDGYHLYELAFDPAWDEVRLFVNGEVRASGISADESFDVESTISVGSTHTFGTGHAHYNLVKFEIVPEPSSPVSTFLGVVGLSSLGRRKCRRTLARTLRTEVA